MEQATVSGGNLLVAVKAAFALIKVSGRATFKLAPSLKRFCMNAIAHGCREIVFDMEDCQGMDSTFMGVLAGIAIHPAKKGDIHLIVMNLSARTHDMLATLGLERVLECHEQADPPPELKRLLIDALHLEGLDEDADRTMSLTTMLQAHQHLVDIDPENIVRFRDVLTYLDQEVQRNGAGTTQS
jgi:anti-anti-sigma factor